MADIIVSKIQLRRGLRQDLPQPLDAAEPGLCTDTGQMFIGADIDDPNGIISPIIEVLEHNNTDTLDANTVINNRLVLVELSSLQTEADIANDFGVIVDHVKVNENNLNAFVAFDAQAAAYVTVVSGSVDSVTLSNPGYGYTGPTVTVPVSGGDGLATIEFTVVNGSLTSPTITNAGSGYTNGQTHLDISFPGVISLPVVAYGTPVFLGTEPGIQFVDGIVDFSGLGYEAEDLSNITTLCNAVYRRYDSQAGSYKPGLVRVKQNIEILTEYSKIHHVADSVFSGKSKPVRTVLDINTGINYNDVSGAEFLVDSTNSIIIEYSATDSNTYNRVGTIMISCMNGVATLNDSFTEVNPGLLDLTFEAHYDTSVVYLRYKKPNATDLKMSMMIRRWNSDW